MEKKILVVFGTRPEAIKMSPLVKLLKQEKNINIKVCVTGQHKEMLEQVLQLFSIEPDFNLDVMKKNQSLSDLSATIISKLHDVFDHFKPDLVLVHGDTSTTLCTSIGAYYHQIAVGHIEAGLRTYNLFSPWPEEGNRQITSVISKYHFAPTDTAAENLYKQNIDKKYVFITGNTVIDALFEMKNKIETDGKLLENLESMFSYLDFNKQIVLITGHRRENWGKGFENICQAIYHLSKKFPEIEFVYPVHLNPNVINPVNKMLSNQENIHLIKPQEYLPFIYLMSHSYLILTDSGGIQEEAPSLGIPVLLMRDTTERQEAVEAGTVRLVGTNPDSIISEVSLLLNNKSEYIKMSQASNPYGDGKASKRIVNIINSNIQNKVDYVSLN